MHMHEGPPTPPPSWAPPVPDRSRSPFFTSSRRSSSDSLADPCDLTSLQASRRKYFARTSSSKLRIANPYSRLLAKKDDSKRRRIWNHAMEKAIFSPCELSTLGAPSRRMIYVASLEAYIDQLHAQLDAICCYPVSSAELAQFRGLNFKTAKGSVSTLQHEVSVARLKLLELERANAELEGLLHTPTKSPDLRCNL